MVRDDQRTAERRRTCIAAETYAASASSKPRSHLRVEAALYHTLEVEDACCITVFMSNTVRHVEVTGRLERFGTLELLDKASE